METPHYCLASLQYCSPSPERTTIFCSAQSNPPIWLGSRGQRGRYQVDGGTIKSYNVHHCDVPTEIKVVLSAEPRCNPKPCLLEGSSFPRSMDICNGWVFKQCSHEETSPVPRRPLCNPITHGRLVHGSNHTLTHRGWVDVQQEWIQWIFRWVQDKTGKFASAKHIVSLAEIGFQTKPLGWARKIVFAREQIKI